MSEREVVIGTEQRGEAVLLAGEGQADPLLPGHVLLAFDHQADVHTYLLPPVERRPRRADGRTSARRIARAGGGTSLTMDGPWRPHSSIWTRRSSPSRARWRSPVRC